ncbi:MAG: hypothetical protein LUH82_03890 [Clostridiales bacterium]|nr:hypothetical protein [Clostridiales bacterium]
MDLKNNIKVIDSFQKVINSLYMLIQVLRVIGIAFLAIQAMKLMLSKAD